MAKGEFLSPYQRGIVRRYYEHKDTLAHQRLSEIVSELYLCDDPEKAEALWQRVHSALLTIGASKPRVEHLVATRDLKALAALVNELF